MEKNTIQVKLLPDNNTLEVPQGTRAIDLKKRQKSDIPIVGVKINNAIKDLRTPLEQDCTLEFIDLGIEDGMRIYERSLIMVLVRATCEVLPTSTVTVKHSLGNGVYGKINYTRVIKDSDIQAIEKRMQEIVEADETITRYRVKQEEAEELFHETGEFDKVGLLKYRQTATMEIHTCGWFKDYSYGTIVPSTGYLKIFRLRYYLPGFILELPRKEDPTRIPEYEEQGKLAHVFYEADKWGKILGVPNVVSLNDHINCGNPGDLVRVTEAFHEKKIGQIADLISHNIDSIRLILIAGPSSSGKTTFAQRLSIQLRVNGIQPVAISLDDYFVDRELTPLDENGKYDFECMDALDHSLFNEHLIQLVQGEEVEIPTYNFNTGKREYHGHTLQLKASSLLIVEGIHGLNDRLTRAIPKSRKFKIYVSPLTQLNLDRHHRIPTTDVRILRRIIRDNKFRGYTARETMSRWPSVRKGEKKYIFPFQEQADVMFNSALVYELSALKNFAEPLLAEITRDHPEHSEARRLRKFLSYFTGINTGDIPANSIIREFIGGTCF